MTSIPPVVNRHLPSSTKAYKALCVLFTVQSQDHYVNIFFFYINLTLPTLIEYKNLTSCRHNFKLEGIACGWAWKSFLHLQQFSYASVAYSNLRFFPPHPHLEGCNVLNIRVWNGFF